MALYRFAPTPSTPSVLEVLDVTNPLKPALMCTLIPADGGQFGQSSDEVVFWVGTTIGTADLRAGKVLRLGDVPAGSAVGAYDRTQRQVAYTEPGEADGFARHLLRLGGQDRTLYVQQPIGGHGGPPCGPYAQLQFSPGGTELLDYSTFRPTTGPANLLLFKSDGSLIFQQTGISFGQWAPAGDVLYFAVSGASGFTGEIGSVDATGHRVAVATGLASFCWPVIAPDGRSLVFDAYDTSAPGQATGGLPHLWRLDLDSGAATQLASAVSSHPVFIGPAVVWSNEEQPCQCGPGGASAVDGVILAYDLSTGGAARVDMSLTVPGIGAPPAGLGDVLDVRFS